MTNLTPAQLEQFEGTFRYFDRDETNTLDLPEMEAALASLGIVYAVCYFYYCVKRLPLISEQEEDLYIIYEDLMREYGAITFEAFINLLVGITEDQMSLDQLREAFQGVAGDKVRRTSHTYRP